LKTASIEGLLVVEVGWVWVSCYCGLLYQPEYGALTER